MKIFRQEKIYMFGKRVKPRIKQISCSYSKCAFYSFLATCPADFKRYFSCIAYDDICTFHEII